MYIVTVPLSKLRLSGTVTSPGVSAENFNTTLGQRAEELEKLFINHNNTLEEHFFSELISNFRL